MEIEGNFFHVQFFSILGYLSLPPTIEERLLSKLRNLWSKINLNDHDSVIFHGARNLNFCQRIFFLVDHCQRQYTETLVALTAVLSV